MQMLQTRLGSQPAIQKGPNFYVGLKRVRSMTPVLTLPHAASLSSLRAQDFEDSIVWLDGLEAARKEPRMAWNEFGDAQLARGLPT